MSDTRSHLKSVNELFTHDKKIWLKVSSALQNISNEKLNYTGADSRTLYTSNDFIYASWPVLVFIFWVMSSHILGLLDVLLLLVHGHLCIEKNPHLASKNCISD